MCKHILVREEFISIDTAWHLLSLLYLVNTFLFIKIKKIRILLIFIFYKVISSGDVGNITMSFGAEFKRNYFCIY